MEVVVKRCVVNGCNADCEKNRRYCREHYLEQKRIRYKEHYAKHGRVSYDKVCEVCGKCIKAWVKNQRFCLDCYNQVRSIGSSGINNYENAKGDGYCWKHLRIAENILQRKLTTDEVVHHINCNPKDNSLDNLIVISRGKHASLHNYLRMQGVTLLKNDKDNLENRWRSFIIPLTIEWLNTTGVKVIKLWEIDQASSSKPMLDGGCLETIHEITDS